MGPLFCENANGGKCKTPMARAWAVEAVRNASRHAEAFARKKAVWQKTAALLLAEQ
jgi:hypothetical protein